ncbi:zf-TFIIB domain-containing protein [Chloroflexota bacterium]
MICPVCKSDMIVVEYHNIELDYCTECKGVWFDSGELELLLRSYQAEGVEPFLENFTNSPDARSSEKKRKCPICRRRMDKKVIGEHSRLLIDMCGEGHGLWFDGGEIAQLISQLVGEPQVTKGSENEVISFLEEVFKAP